MSDYVPPCARPENDPNDWFIERDGKQYPDEDLLTEEERATLSEEEAAEREEEVRRDRLRARRHARDACHTECYMRLECLDRAIKERPQYGIWGGYFPEQLREIYREYDRRHGR